jgi:hypothetical protein
MGTTDLRTPKTDDVNAICGAYPIDRTPTGACTGLPRHGFAPECYAQQTYVHCAAGPAPASGSSAPSAAPALLLAAAALAFRGRRGSRGS